MIKSLTKIKRLDTLFKITIERLIHGKRAVIIHSQLNSMIN